MESTTTRVLKQRTNTEKFTQNQPCLPTITQRVTLIAQLGPQVSLRKEMRPLGKEAPTLKIYRLPK